MTNRSDCSVYLFLVFRTRMNFFMTESSIILSYLILSQVQSLWRTAYKLTRLFASPEYRGPLRAAMTIKGKLEKFRIHMPLINVLCNPGIKDRHWQLMSEQVRAISDHSSVT